MRHTTFSKMTALLVCLALIAATLFGCVEPAEEGLYNTDGGTVLAAGKNSAVQSGDASTPGGGDGQKGGGQSAGSNSSDAQSSNSNDSDAQSAVGGDSTTPPTPLRWCPPNPPLSPT